MKRQLLALSPVLASSTMLISCEQLSSLNTPTPPDSTTNAPAAEVVDTNGDPSLRMSRQAILDMFSDASCDGLSGVTGQVSSQYNRGLRGVITVPTAAASVNTSTYGHLDNFLGAGGRSLSNKLYFSEVNVPTRAFSKGFPRLDGGLIKDDANQTLVEYFRIDLDGFIELPAGQPEGDYEFAMLADDGAELHLGSGGFTYASAPSHQETKMICGTTTVHMRPGETLPMKLSYFQGPRYHIALVLLWRPASSTAESLCGKYGNSYWFNSNVTPSAPTANYRALESRAWNVVPRTAFRLPDEELLNPCQSDHVRDVFDECGDSSCGGIGI